MAWSDLAAAVDTAGVATFAQTVAYTPLGGAEVDVAGVFDAPGIRLDLSGGVAIETMGPPRFAVMEADLPNGAAQRGDRWRIGGVTYRVTEIQRDGYGLVTLTGEKTG
jgi:hypothetical protein